MTTHIVKETYSLLYKLYKNREVIKDWTIRTYCGREYPDGSVPLAERGATICRNCERSHGPLRRRDEAA